MCKHEFIANNCENSRVFVCEGEGMCGMSELWRKSQLSITTAAYYADAEFFACNQSETRSTVSQIPLSRHPHVP